MIKIIRNFLVIFCLILFPKILFGQISEAQQHLNDGNRFAKQLRWDEAIGEYDLAIEKNYQYVDAYIARAKAYQVRGMNEKAMQDYNMALKLNPSNVTVYDLRANLSMLLDNYTGAISDLNEAIRLNPKDSLTQIELGLAKLNTKDFEQSIVEYTKSIEIYPSFVQAYLVSLYSR